MDLYASRSNIEKALFDTSCIHAVIAPDLEPSVCKQIPQPSKTCKYFTSMYLRMEFLRRWIITGIEIYARAGLTKDIAETLNWFSHRFGSRENKIVLQWSAHNTKSFQEDPTGEPVQRFGWLVIKLAFRYDQIFKKFVQPRTSCKRGLVEIDSNSPTMRKALFDFHERFSSPEHTCKLESLLNIGKGFPKLRRVLDTDPSDYPRESRRSLKELQKNLERFVKEQKTPTCQDCHTIADVLVALEQPPKTTLYHIDHSFSALCPILKHRHKLIQSVLASAPGIPDISSQ